jgi:predicted choloylglycine hydrolase
VTKGNDMTQMTLTFDAVDERSPGPKWQARWQRSWPAYQAWFTARGGDNGPNRAECRAAMQHHMPELLPVYDRLVLIAGGSDQAARFLSTWCPPAYLGGCSLAAVAGKKNLRLVRNYDLSPSLNEGFLLRSAWTGRAVMGMVEFLWGLSDGINDAGLVVALAYGGRSETAQGFGITTILRYILETCDSVEAALAVLRRVPSHMAYNLVLADASGATISVALSPGGGVAVMPKPIATNHQNGVADRPAFTRSFERHAYLDGLRVKPRKLKRHFLKSPLLQDRYAEGFGTLFTAEYNPKKLSLELTLNGTVWQQSLAKFREGQRHVDYAAPKSAALPPAVPLSAQQPLWTTGFGGAQAADFDWVALANHYASGWWSVGKQ